MNKSKMARIGSFVDLSRGAKAVDSKHILDNGPNCKYNNPDPNAKFPKQKTNIICTLGPVSRDVPKLEEMLKGGMRVARFNFSHGTHQYHQETLDALRQACLNTGIECAALLDTKGPEIRTGMLDHGEPVQLHKDSIITLTTDYTAKGNEKLVAVSYPSLAKHVSEGSKILCADGSITFTVISCDVDAGTVQVRCENSAKLGERKNMNLPGVNVDLPTITEKDRDDLLNWGVKNNVDFVAASFVRKGSDIDYIREVLGPEASKTINIISKVENMEGLDNYDEIVEKSDAVMVARGDLGMEIHLEQIFLAQKRMIKRCNEAGKPVIVATQMLESMTGAPRPTRAEATDVANSVLDGTDCVMLSGETAAGAYPVEAVTIMADICRESEAYVDNYAVFKNLIDHQPIPMATLESLASSAVRSAHKVGAELIVCLAKSGRTAQLLAKYRPNAQILAVCVEDPHDLKHDASSVARRLLLSRGICPIVAPLAWRASKAETDADPVAGAKHDHLSVTETRNIMQNAIDYAKKLGMVQEGDKVVGVHRIVGDSIMKIVECH
eukprot:CAMPEP_0181360042 /NCGR_PEP_ID=MMETSP1106-20121128/6439_1 /TAXON_ID=81844 /ORGANISM="Mantoniella antarctica, Strain SL-175" /LENGTH=552 /DNA_ID=CAMNT_0023473257 /DNA_START=135 /DNA_END=1793 /DNA_ORIENTATION=+